MLLTPNMLSIFRLCLVPLFVVLYLSGLRFAHLWGVLVYVLAMLTDILDGWIARRFNLITNLGKVLDPLGDKMFTFAVLACMNIERIIPFWILAVYLVKELLMGLGGLLLHRRAKADIPASNRFGKAATALFFVVCVVLMLCPIPRTVALVMIGVALAVSLMAFASYLQKFSHIMKERRGKTS
jgi:CDP-diacylglycerol--glycerol-3-phosphate 3-phosphatidyltransferase